MGDVMTLAGVMERYTRVGDVRITRVGVERITRVEIIRVGVVVIRVPVTRRL